jgi:hypothetical protein
MKGFFDTSVLVPVFYGDHDHNQALRNGSGQIGCAPRFRSKFSVAFE